jgi:type IV pilus assembly protein PilW
VGAVQIGLLVRNSGNSGERAASAQSAVAQTVMQVSMPAPNDNNYRSTYETTVALRNRLYGN